MTWFTENDADVVVLRGSPADRGRDQVKGAPIQEVVGTMTERIEKAREAGHLGDAAQQYLEAQYDFAVHASPNAIAELSGIADGFKISEADLFSHLHLGILGDMAQTRRGDHDGCSAWAVSDGPDGPMVVKNRDFSGQHAGIQRVFRHHGEDLDHGPVLCLGSLGSPGAYSSGMNAAGLAVVDTQVGVRRHSIGWLRYFLMSELLAHAATVDEALEFIRSVSHAGGGTLVLADAAGAVAAVELGADAIATETANIVGRTNHFTTAALASETLFDEGSRIDASSAKRRKALDQILPSREWGAEAAADLMAQHEEDAGGAPICQHGEAGLARTIASAIYCCRSGLMYASLERPCSGQWSRIRVTA